MQTAEVRQSFLDYFRKHEHHLVPSAPVIPFNDPTILFINAGMNQFKDVFTGQRRVEYSRATSSQKCIRAGGKHNDLDNVGFTARHHTFFEMLGNFSFGDYYKEEAISYAWEWVTKYLKLPVDRLYATVYETDDDAFALWGKIASELRNGRIMRFGKKDNFWSMGEIGPCGPCSEIHFDRGEKFGTGPDDVVNGETDRFMEIWNLVFMQDDQLADGRVVPLPKPSVDTGAGLERIAAVMQNADTNYGIDIFQALITAISDLTHAKYADHVASHHVVADHIRALTFAIADGGGISNEGRGYVLRRILRRAARHGRLLGAKEPFIYKLVPVLVEQMGQTYPEIKEKQGHIMNVLRSEEESFLRTLETGLDLFEKIARKTTSAGAKVIAGNEVFRLYDTYGFPYDLTEILATEQGLTLDQSGFDRAMSRQQEQSRAASNFNTVIDWKMKRIVGQMKKEGWPPKGPTKFVRDALEVEANVLASPGPGEWPDFAVVLDKTPFYVEAGGQVGDTGRIYNDYWEMEVKSTFAVEGYIVHFGKIKRGDKDGLYGVQPNIYSEPVIAAVDRYDRWDIMRNHTATHLMHAALRTVLGEHVKQSGSYVGPDRLRFDFSHHQPMTPEEIARVEEIVNARILEGTEVGTQQMNVNEAKKSGAMALFGEKYGETVRVVSVSDFSKELCGGTHVDNVSQIGPFFVTLETGVASGIRRIEAITGREATRFMLEAKKFQQQTAQLVGRPVAEAYDGLQRLKDDYAVLQKELKKTKEAMFAGNSGSVGTETKLGELVLITHDFGATDRDTMGAWLDSQKGMNHAVVAVGLGEVDGKRAFMAAASSAAVKRHKVHIGAMTKELLPQYGGRGGGKESFAQGGIANDTSADELFTKVKSLLE